MVDNKQYSKRFDTILANAEKSKLNMDRRKENTFMFAESSVDSIGEVMADKKSHIFSQLFPIREHDQQPRTKIPQGEMKNYEHNFESERMEKQIQLSTQPLNQKKYVQQQQMLMQQSQMQQQQQQSQLLMQHKEQSPDWQQQGPNAIDREEAQTSKQSVRVQSPTSVQFSHSFEGMTAYDLFAHCQNHLNIINACTDLQQTIKDEMKKQAKLDNIICQKLLSKAQRLQQQAAVLEKVHAPGWVGPVLLELGSQVNQQAEIHHLYTTTLLEQCIVIQHSLDGHHELMKSVLGQNNKLKSPPFLPLEEPANKAPDKLAHSASQNKGGEGSKSMTFLQASTIFEGIRQPRMKLLSSLEYQQEQLSATVMHLEQVQSEIEGLLKTDENDTLGWRIQLQKKDLEIRKDFLEARKDQLESDVQFARMDLNDFEFSNKDRMVEVFNVFCQHRARYDTTLRQSFQLLKAASLRDSSFLKKLIKKSAFDVNIEHESGDASENIFCPKIESWSYIKKTASNVDASDTPRSPHKNDQTSPLSTKLQNSLSPQTLQTTATYLTNIKSPNQTQIKSPRNDKAYQIMLSSDSEISFMSKGEVDKNNLLTSNYKQANNSTVGFFKGSPFKKLSDFNFSRAEISSSAVEEENHAKSNPDTASTCSSSSESLVWNVVKEKEYISSIEDLNYENDEDKLIIAKYSDDQNFSQIRPTKGQIKRGADDIMIMRSDSKSVRTLGNFENYVNNDCDVRCLYPMSSFGEISYNREEKRVSHLINKYASSSSRTSIGKNWNSCKPLVWCGISNEIIKESVSRHNVSRGLKYYEPLAQHNSLMMYNKKKHLKLSQTLNEDASGKNQNNSEARKGYNDNFNSCEHLSEHKDVNSHDLPKVQKNHELSSGQQHDELSTGQQHDKLSTGTKHHELTDKNNHELSTEQKNNELSSCLKNNDLSTGHISQKPSKRQINCALLEVTGSSQGANGCRSSTESNMAVNENTCEPSREQNVNVCEQRTDRQITSGCDLFEKQSHIQNIENCDILSGQVSRNLNNCEPLKAHIVDDDNVLEGEDCLEFEVTQVLFPVSQPRNIRVCAVRPIPSEAAGGGERTNTDNSQTVTEREHTRMKTVIPYKFDNLRLFEATAGEYMVHEQGTEFKNKTTSKKMTTDSSNKKQADSRDCRTTKYSSPVCSNKSVPSSHWAHNSASHEIVESNTELQSAINDCDTLPTATVTTWQSTNVLQETINMTITSGKYVNSTTQQTVSTQFHETVDQNQRTCQNNLHNIFTEDDSEIRSPLSEPKLYWEQNKKTRNLSPFGSSNRGCVQVAPNISQSDAIPDCNRDEEETFPKTVYIPEELETKFRCSHESGNIHNPTNVSEMSNTGVCTEDQDLIEHTVLQGNEHNRNTTELTAYTLNDDSNIYNIRRQAAVDCVQDNDSWTCFFEDEDHVEDRLESSTTHTVFMEDERNMNDTFSPDSLDLEPPVTVNSVYQLNQLNNFDERVCNSHYQNTQQHHREQMNAQSFENINELTNITLPPTFKDCDEDEFHLQENYNQEYSEERKNYQSFQDIQQSTNRSKKIDYPLKSSLKRPSSAYSFDVESELHSNYQNIFPYGLMSLNSPITNELCLQTQGQLFALRQINKETGRHQNIGKIRKCVKQVRFHDRVQYDDHTESDTIDVSISKEDISSMFYSLNKDQIPY